MTWAVSIALSLTLGAAPGDVPADPDVAAGEAAYRAGRFEEAATAFARAYQHTGDPTYLYTQAQAERQAGRCDVAIELYQEFLGSSPSDEAALAVRDNIALCKEALAAEPAPVEPEPEPTPSVPPPVDNQPRPQRRPWYRDPLGGALVGTGGAALVAGGVITGLAYQEAARADDAGDDRSYGDNIDRSHRLEVAGAATMSIGAVLAIAGAIRWGLLSRRAPKSTSLRIGAWPGGALVSGHLPPAAHLFGQRSRSRRTP